MANTGYGLHLSDELEKRLLRCRAPVRDAIRERLQEIANAADAAAAKKVARGGPPLRFYVYEGYRVVYQLDAASRRVVVVDLEALAVD